MKNVAQFLPLAALLVPAVVAWAPSCGYNDCMQAWDGSVCTASSGWDCICSNATALAQINTCVATTCTNITDQEAIYGAIAQNCANNGVKVTNSQQATFSATSGGSVAPAITGPGGWGPNGGWNSGSWASWVSNCGTAAGSAPSGWNGNGPWGGGWRGGPGGWGGNGGYGGNGGSGAPGPWGTKASGVNCASYTTWTAGWGPFSSWTGTWSGCSTKTDAPVPATITTTVTTGGSTQILTGTTFGIQAAAAATSSGGVTVNKNSASSDMVGLKLYAIIAAAVFTAMLAL